MSQGTSEREAAGVFCT